MSDYDRSTTSATLATLPEPLAAAMRAKAQALQLTVADDAAAFVTHSRRRRRTGLLAKMLGGDPDREHLTALVIGAKDVLVGTHGEKRGTAVLAARLDDVDVSRLPRIGSDPADDGMSVNGFPVSGPDGGRGSYYVGLGAPEGETARQALIAAVTAAKA